MDASAILSHFRGLCPNSHTILPNFTGLCLNPDNNAVYEVLRGFATKCQEAVTGDCAASMVVGFCIAVIAFEGDGYMCARVRACVRTALQRLCTLVGGVVLGGAVVYVCLYV
jgi:hypothetical protein